MNNNELLYSHEWQDYKDDYDKCEYDIELKDGTIVENCYPNAGKFHSISDVHNGKSFDEKDVSKIRLSENERFGINEHQGVVVFLGSDIDDEVTQVFKDYDEGITQEPATGSIEALSSLIRFDDSMMRLGMPKPLTSKYGRVLAGVREKPVQKRNERCHCGSGNKFKRCCIKKTSE